MSGDEYECTLDPESIIVAEKELHEDPKNRLGAVETLRKWIEEQPHIKFTTETQILLLYLRHAKFSQLKARETIQNYCAAKREIPEWYDDYDPFDPITIKFARQGFMFPLPGYDKLGRKLVVIRNAAYDPAEWKDKKPQLIKAINCFFYQLLYDERTQVNGTVFLDDMTGLTLAHQTFFTMDEMRKSIRIWQKTVPGRYKAFYEYNCGPVWEAFMAMCMPFLNKKFKDRMVLAGNNMENLYDTFPRHMLPTEYLPDDYDGPTAGSISSLVENFIQDMQRPEVERFLKTISSKEWKEDASKKPEAVPQESFRKLNVD